MKVTAWWSKQDHIMSKEQRPIHKVTKPDPLNTMAPPRTDQALNDGLTVRQGTDNQHMWGFYIKDPGGTEFPSIQFLFLLLSNLLGLLEPIPAFKGREAGYTLDRSPAYRRANTQRQTFTLTNTYGQFRLINWPDKHVFGSGEETGLPGENPRMHRENMQTPHRTARAEIQTPNLLAVRRPPLHRTTRDTICRWNPPLIPTLARQRITPFQHKSRAGTSRVNTETKQMHEP